MNGRLTFLLVIVSLAISYSTWTYSFRMVKPPVKTVQKPSTIGSKHSDSSKKPHRSTLLTTNLSTQSLRAIIAKVPTAFISTKLPRRKKYVQSRAGGAVALPLPFAGFRSMAFTVKHLEIEVDEESEDTHEALGSLEWCSVGSKSGFRIHCDLSIERGEVAVTTRVASGGMCSQDVDDITELIESALKKELEGSIHLVAARERQEQARKKNADAAAVVAKKKQLDQIIHPEKYRGRSPTVRKSGSASGSAGGSGRYMPSASTQARRQVKKG